MNNATATLPFRATTATGATFDIAFPLHPDTLSAARTGSLVRALLAALDDDLQRGEAAANGDVLQALAMTLAIRSGMIHAPPAVSAALARSLLDDALAAFADAAAAGPAPGHA